MKQKQKVTAEQWVEIIGAYRAGAHLPTVAKEHKITPGYIYNFVNTLKKRGFTVERGKKDSTSLVNQVIELSKK